MSKNKRNVNTMLSRFLLIFSATILFAFITIISASPVFAVLDIIVITSDPSVVDSSFTPQIGSSLVRQSTVYLGRSTTYVGEAIGVPDDTIKWRVTISHEADSLTPNMVDMDEVGFLDPPSEVPNNATYHYPFAAQEDGSLVTNGSCDSINVHDNNCPHDVGFSLDVNDIFTNADKIKFNSNAPLGTYTIKYELVDTAGEPDTILSNAYEVNVNVIGEVTLTRPSPEDLTIEATTFGPALGSILAKNVDAYYNIRSVSSFADTIPGVQWRITIIGPEGFTPSMVDLDEVGWEDLGGTNIQTFHYPFVGSGTLVATGSCTAPDPVHDDTCGTDFFDVDPNDDFTNVDKIKFALDAPLGTYTIKRQLVYADGSPISNELTVATIELTADLTTLEVGEGKPYTTIQSAIDDASPGNTINVAAGTYIESLAINKGVMLQGAGRDVTTVTGAPTVTANNVTIDGFNFGGTITIDDSSAVVSDGTISNNIITGSGNGIRLGSGVGQGIDHITIRDNEITGNSGKGIAFYNAGDYAAQHISYITISGNNITNNGNSGISTYGPGPNTITNNNVSGNTGNGISIKYDNGDIVTGNTVTGNTAMGINMHQVTNSTVENNTVSGHVSTGVVTTFWGSSITAGKGSAIYIHEVSTGNAVRLNDLKDNKIGVLVSREVGSDGSPSNNSINENKITGNTEYGILNALVDPPAPVNAENNYWDSATPDFTALVLGDVDYSPWYTDAEMTTLISVAIASANLADIDEFASFDPQIDTTLIRGINAYIGRFSDYTSSAIDTGIQWHITVTGPSALTADMIHIDEVGWKDILNGVNVQTFHYPFTVQDGTLVAQGSESTPDHGGGAVDSFGLDENDEFTNADKINFSSNAPAGDYNITYELVDTKGTEDTSDDIILSNAFQITVTVQEEVQITSADPDSTLVDETFTPEIDSALNRRSSAYIGRTSTYTGAATNPDANPSIDTIKWKVTIIGPSALTEDIVDMDEVGFNDPPATESNIATYHYPFEAVGGNLVAVGSCDATDTHNNTCLHDIGFSLDVNDEFTNADNITFSSAAPLGDYIIKYELVDTSDNTVLSNAYEVNFTLNPATSSDFPTEEDEAIADEQEEVVDEGINEVIVLVGSPVENIIVNFTDDERGLNISLVELKNSTGEVTLVNDFNLTRQTSTVNYTAEIPSGTVISGGSDWDGKINVPTVRNAASYSAPSGTVDVVVDVGSGTEINFSNPVKITLGGQAGKKAAWARGTSTLTEITTVCDSVSNPTNINTVSPRECYIDSGSDLIIWTYHFTQFGSYTPASAPAPSGGGVTTGGGGGGGGVAYSWQCGEWSECSSQGIQTRSCSLATGSGGSSTKPAETQTCTYTAPAPAVEEAPTSAAPTTPASAPAVTTTAPTAPTGAAVAPPTGFAALTGAFISDLKKPGTWIGIIVAVLAAAALYAGYYYLYKRK